MPRHPMCCAPTCQWDGSRSRSDDLGLPRHAAGGTSLLSKVDAKPSGATLAWPKSAAKCMQVVPASSLVLASASAARGAWPWAPHARAQQQLHDLGPAAHRGGVHGRPRPTSPELVAGHFLL